jgi:anti-sigma factor ChrR (cupin superfamily)
MTPVSDFILKPEQQDWMPFPIPGATAEKLNVTFMNRDISRGPVVALLRMAPGAFIPAHIHHRTSEIHFVVEGDFINAGDSLAPGSFIAHGPGVAHGPHESQNGCLVMFIQPVEVDPTDFEIAP